MRGEIQQENITQSAPVEPSAPSLPTRPVLSLVQPLHQASAPNSHTGATPVWKPVSPLLSTAPKSEEPLHQIPAPTVRTKLHQESAPTRTSVAPVANHLPYEWRTEWKTSSEDVRAIWKRLYVFENNRWRRAERPDKIAGKVPNVVINQRVKSFTREGAARIERIGDESIRRTIESLLNQRTIRRAA